MKTYKTFVSLAGLVTGLFFSSHAYSQNFQPVCMSYFSPLLQKTVPYCIDRTHPELPIAPGERVAYFMHGTNGSAKTWTKNNYANSLNEMREIGEILPPMTFVSFNTSPYSFFTDHPNKPESAYETWFITEFIPYIENTYGVCNQKQCRALIGESMGGFGALKTALRHTDLFATVAVNSPALPPFSVRASVFKWEWFFSHHIVGPVLGLFLIELVRKIFPNEESWDANDPIQLSQNTPPELFPPLYFDMGGWDNYGFNVGYWILKQTLDDRSIPYSTVFEPHSIHDMWKRHAADSIRFVSAHTADEDESIAPIQTAPTPAPDSILTRQDVPDVKSL